MLGDFVVAIDALMEGLQIIGPDWRYLYVNPAVATQAKTTPSQLVGRTMMECFPGIEQTPLFTTLERCQHERTSAVFENEFRHNDGTTGWFELRVEPVPQGLCILSIDITERRLAEERARHTERMHAIGQLAAGVAHDFNNLLSVMLVQGEIALSRPEGLRATDLEVMLDAAKRSAELTRQLLAYGRRQVMRKTSVDLAALIEGMRAILTGALGSHIAFELRASEPVSRVEADPTQLEQVVMNLVLNARDAMPSGGRITVSLENAGPQVLLTVTDTGTGMDTATQARIFEPFFTTKGLGQGTGLGLSTVYGIVKQAGGDISVQSELGKGATFEVSLPRAVSDAVLAPPKVETDRAGGNGELVLVVDDEAVLARLMEIVLRNAGYRVLRATSGAEALRACSAEPVALLITDVFMPHMSGLALLEQARRLRPELKVVYTSGYGAAELEEREGIPKGLLLLEKPFAPKALASIVRSALSGS